MHNRRFTFIDLFSGIGGFRLALNNLGGDCIGYSEINNDAIKTYCKNFDEDEQLNFGNITKIENLPKHDLLTGGVPCQSWSIAGKNLGFDDDRGQLWNDTIYLLNKIRPKAFIFENVKGLVDPRNKVEFSYIMERIKEAGYFANYYLLNSYDYGVPQNRLRVYIVGFAEESHELKFNLPNPLKSKIQLNKILKEIEISVVLEQNNNKKSLDLFGEVVNNRKMSLSQNNGLNDYFLFNDLRNGHSTIHSWDIIKTTQRQKEICYLLLKNRRKPAYGILDGNPLSLKHFQDLDKSIDLTELIELEKLEILKSKEYSFEINDFDQNKIDDEEFAVLNCAKDYTFTIDILKNDKNIKVKKISISKNIEKLKLKKIISCSEIRFDFKNSKISTGLNGINRIFLPKSKIFPTLVASDTNDFIALKDIVASNEEEFKLKFIEEIYNKGLFRKITKKEACLIQGFPEEFNLPESRARWMKLIGNSVSVPVIQMLGKAIIETGVFGDVVLPESKFKEEVICV
jgi:DNA (cytosine-5)-methyltransferase 1